MRPRDQRRALKLESALRVFDKQNLPLPGIRPPENFATFLEQLLESIHRVEYISVIRSRKLSDLRADPSSDLFDPLKAAVLRQREGWVDEAFWLVFLSVHFGKNTRAGWRYAREVYGRLGAGEPWDWARTSADPVDFRHWLGAHEALLRRAGVPRGFGNHRKYESLDAWSERGTGAVVESYVRWIGAGRTHQALIQEAQERCNEHPRKMFDYLYHSMDAVISFGRMAKFDYLTMLGKLGLAQIEPGWAYLKGSTGPLMGARLLFGGSTSAALDHSVLDAWLVELDRELNVGMQVLEDALCNWQKSPGKFKAFRG